MSDRKKLALRDPSDEAEGPALKKKGRGWEISEKRLDALHDRAREMRRHSSPAHKALAERLAGAAAACGRSSRMVGVPFGTDASAFGRMAPTVVFGPGSIEQAHTVDEWIAVEQLEAATAVLQTLLSDSWR